MPHPEIRNRTPFVVEPLFLADEEGRPIVAPLLKGTLDVGPSGVVSLADQQEPVSFAGEFYGEPDTSSYRLEPEVAFIKPGTDVVLLGHAHAPHRGTTEVEVTLMAGPLRKTVRVSGDRWVELGIQSGMSAPLPFEAIPLTWERSFGGWDRSPEDPEDHAFEPRNPVGVGFVGPKGRIYEGSPLPNLEDPRDPLRAVGGRCRPAGFGFTGPGWEPRTFFAGTYDQAWADTRSPLLPKDFDRRFFNAAPEGLVSQTPFAGDEWIQVFHATPGGRWVFQLPGIPDPVLDLTTRWGEERTLAGKLDTVIVDADRMQVQLLWRTYTGLREGPLDVVALEVAFPHFPAELGRNMAEPAGLAGPEGRR